MSVIIAASPRSGSWLLADGLEASGSCGHPREYFRTDYMPVYARACGTSADAPLTTYTYALMRATCTPNGVFSVKIHGGQLAEMVSRTSCGDARELVEVLFPNRRFIYLRRTDTARAAVSLFEAIRSNRWWVTSDLDAAPKRATPSLTATDAAEIARLERVVHEEDEIWSRFFESGGIAPIQIDYGELCHDFRGTVTDLLRCLEMPAGEITSRLQRQAGPETEALLAQYEAWTRRSASEGGWLARGAAPSPRLAEPHRGPG